MPIAVRDLQGRVAFYIDGEVARDDAGKVVADPSREPDDDRGAALASRWLAGRRVAPGEQRRLLADVAVGDVSQPATVADFGIGELDGVADAVSAIRHVKHFSGTWYPEKTGDATKLVVAAASLDGQVAEVNPRYTPTQFTTLGYAIGAKIPRFTVSNADFDLKRRTLRLLIENLRLAREQRVATLLTTSTNWFAANQIAVLGKWNAGPTADPLIDLFAGLQASAMPSNALVLPENLDAWFHRDPHVRDYVQSGGVLPRRLVARARTRTSTGATPNAYVWAPTAPSNVLLARLPGDPDALPTSVTFRWLADDKAGSRDGKRVEGVLVRQFQDPDDRFSDWITVAHNDAEVMVTPSSDLQCGALLVGAYA